MKDSPCPPTERADDDVNRRIPWLRVFVEGVVIVGKRMKLTK